MVTTYSLTHSYHPYDPTPQAVKSPQNGPDENGETIAEEHDPPGCESQTHVAYLRIKHDNRANQYRLKPGKAFNNN